MVIRKFLSNHGYLILASVLILFELFYILKAHWSGDFFEHSAVVNELSRNLIHPNNPILKSDVPHAFFSPYSILVAIFSKLTGLGVIHSLAYFAFFNLLFFLYSFYYFCKCVFKDNYKIIAFIALIFTMVFWGKEPFEWSGFYHLFTMHYVMPYPSTFAMALTLLVLGMVSKHFELNKALSYVIIMVLSAIVLITHPTTAITLYVGIVVLSFTFHHQTFKQAFIKSTLLILTGIFLSFLWPYYSFLDLFFGNASDFHSDSLKLYDDFLGKHWPFLLVFPSLYYFFKDSIIRFLVLCIVLLLLVYLGGYLLGIYGVSRVISSVMMFSHFLIAYYSLILMRDLSSFGKVYISSLLAALVISIGLNFRKIGHTLLDPFKPKDIEYYTQFSFLSTYVNPDDIILSDSDSNWIIPTFNGKVIASGHPLYWIDDLDERRESVNSFFIEQTPDSLRQATLNKYFPNYVLIDYDNVDLASSTLRWLRNIGQTVYKKNQIELIKIKAF